MHASSVLNLSRRTLFAAALVASMAGCATSSKPVSLADTLAKTPALSTLNGLVLQAGLADTLKTGGPFTVFAPTNDAFKAVSAKTMDELAKNPEKLKAVLSFHVLPVKVLAAEVKNSKVKTVQGANLELSKAGEFVTVENAFVTQADLPATNGVIHVIDTVLLPPAAK